MTSDRLRIGVTCYPTFGGSGIVATEIGLSLARRGHRVHFIAYDVPRRLDRFVDNVFFHEVEVLDYPLFAHSQYALALASKMVEVNRWEPLDLLHVHYGIPHATSAWMAREILVGGGERAPKIVTTLHGTDITLVGSHRSFLPITRFSILKSDGITVPSEALRRDTHERLGIGEDVGIEVIPNFVDTAQFKPIDPALHRLDGSQRSALSHLFPRAKVDWRRARVLAHNSNFRPLKRVEDVLSIFAEVRRTAEALLVLIGDGPDRSRLEARVHELGLSDVVCFLGKQLNFVEVLQRADVFLLPSEMESFGLAALEALACGVPVVASRLGGLPEVITDGETGFLRPVGDIPAMAAAVLALLTDDALHARMSKAARECATTRFEGEEMVGRYEAYYRRVLAG